MMIFSIAPMLPMWMWNLTSSLCEPHLKVPAGDQLKIQSNFDSWLVTPSKNNANYELTGCTTIVLICLCVCVAYKDKGMSKTSNTEIKVTEVWRLKFHDNCSYYFLAGNIVQLCNSVKATTNYISVSWGCVCMGSNPLTGGLLSSVDLCQCFLLMWAKLLL